MMMMSKAQTQLIATTLVLFNALHLVAARGRGGGGGGGGSAATEEEPHNPPQSTNTQDCTQTHQCVAIGSARIPISYFIWGGVILGVLVLSCCCCILWKCGVCSKLTNRARCGKQQQKNLHQESGGLPPYSGNGSRYSKGDYASLHSFDQQKEAYNPPYQIQQQQQSYGQGGLGYATSAPGAPQYPSNPSQYYQPPIGAPPRH
ncbi:hypothetical protein FRC16_000252 [Serendipita sp. 398]|nr:hypothetical protein FRC16_000252 [Serendipita sp. 398]